MAYKFQLGAAKLSGSTQFNDRVDVIGDIDLSASSIDSVEIAELNAFSTSDLSEGTNLYYTDARSRASVSAVDAGGDGSFAYNSSTGVFTYTGPSAAEARAHLSSGYMIDYAGGQFSIDASEFSGSWNAVLATKDTGDLAEGSNLYFTDARARAAISVTDAGGDGSLGYNSSTGVITYTGPSAAEAQAHFSAVDTNSVDMSYSAGAFSADVKVDASSIEIDASNGLQVKALGVTNAMLAGGITNAKLVNSTISGIALGSNLGNLTVAAGSALTMSSYNGSAAVADLAVQVDGSSIEVSSNALRVKAGGITNAMLGGSIASTKLAELNNFTTDDLAEGSSNLYYTDARARAAVSAVDAGGDGSFAYNSSTGVFTYTGPSQAEARAHLSADGDLVSYNSTSGLISTNASAFSGSWDVKMAAADTDALSEGSSNLYFTQGRARASISVVDSGGDGSLSYAAATGVITYTGPSAAEARAHFSGGTGVDLSSGGVISIGQAVATSDSVVFASGSFTGDLTVAGDLEVQGALTYLSTTNLEIEDNEVILNKGGTLGIGATAGFRFQDTTSGAADLIIQWDGSDSRFEMLDSTGAFQDLKIKNLAAETLDLSAGGAIVEAIQSIAASSGTTAMANGKTIIMVGKANQVTLPAVAQVSGVVIKIKNDDNACGAGADAIIIAAATGEQIELASSIRLESPSAAISVISDGSKWYVM